MTRHALHATVFKAAFPLLPAQMDSRPARAMLEAIARQESRLRYRRQIADYETDGTPIYGPARGLWQFEEQGGTVAVLEHHASRHAAGQVLAALGYGQPSARTIHRAFEHDDTLACCFARLLLWTDPRLLPQDADGATDGWLIYLRTWQPGKPKPVTWAANFTAAWAPLESEAT